MKKNNIVANPYIFGVYYITWDGVENYETWTLRTLIEEIERCEVEIIRVDFGWQVREALGLETF